MVTYKEFLVPGNELRGFCVDLINEASKNQLTEEMRTKMNQTIEKMKLTLSKIEAVQNLAEIIK